MIKWIGRKLTSRHAVESPDIKMSLSDLAAVTINPMVAREAFAQAEKRLADVLEVKKTVEQKATVLFGACITVALGLSGFGGAVGKALSFMWAVPFFASAVCFVLAAGAFMAVFRSAEYGNLGSEPSMWLVPGRIDGPDEALGDMHAYLTHYYATAINVSFLSNARKSAALHLGMGAGVAGALVLCLALALTFVVSHFRP